MSDDTTETDDDGELADVIPMFGAFTIGQKPREYLPACRVEIRIGEDAELQEFTVRELTGLEQGAFTQSLAPGLRVKTDDEAIAGRVRGRVAVAVFKALLTEADRERFDRMLWANAGIRTEGADNDDDGPTLEADTSQLFPTVQKLLARELVIEGANPK